MIDTVCINDRNKPSAIPDSHWIVKDKEYTVIMIYNMVEQGAILGAVLKEIDLESLDIGYSCFKLDRFGFKLDDMEALLELMKNCGELNDFNLEELLEEQLDLTV
jgi:hypothetical protein